MFVREKYKKKDKLIEKQEIIKYFWKKYGKTRIFFHLI